MWVDRNPCFLRKSHRNKKKNQRQSAEKELSIRIDILNKMINTINQVGEEILTKMI